MSKFVSPRTNDLEPLLFENEVLGFFCELKSRWDNLRMSRRLKNIHDHLRIIETMSDDDLSTRTMRLRAKARSHIRSFSFQEEALGN